MNNLLIWGIALLALSGVVNGLTVEALQMYAVFYPGLKVQPCVRVKVTAHDGERLGQLSFEGLGKGSAVSGSALYRSSAPFFSLYAKAEEAVATRVATGAAKGKVVEFAPSGGVPLQEGINYFWLTLDVASSAKGGEKVAPRLLHAKNGKGEVIRPLKGRDGSRRVDGKTPAVPGVVYPFKYRIAPYIRPKWACVNNKDLLSEDHLNKMTDCIVFGYTHSGVELAPHPDALFRDHDYADECLALVRQLRGSGEGARVVAGFACNEAKNPMCAVMHDEVKRRRLARHVATLVTQKGYDGVDIDWEYPRENGRFGAHATWRRFAHFLAELREELAGTGASLSIAVTTRYDAPNNEVLEGVDFINSMSYGRPGEHSTKAAAREDVNFLLSRHVPPQKVVLGLPFFSRDTKPKHTDGGGCGYGSILRMFPKMAPEKNSFKHPESGEEHFFNGANLIKDKCKTFVLQQGIGGVCIWAYDTDVPLSNPKSLGRALYSVIKQTRR